MNIVANAEQLAHKWHRGQKYGNQPYTEHLKAVVASVEDKYAASGKVASDVVIAVAILHDVLEDTACTQQEIIECTSIYVASCVLALTKNKGESYENYILKVKIYPESLEVKTHDTLCNLTASVMSGENGRIRKYAKQLLLLTER